MRRLAVHVVRGSFCFLQPLIGFFPLLQNDRVPRPQVLLRFLQQAETAVLPDVLDGRAAAFQALYALHPIHGFFVENPAVSAVPLTWQQALVGVKAQRVLRDAEHFRHLPDRIIHRALRKMQKTS